MISQRLAQLKPEYEQGQKMMADWESKMANLEKTKLTNKHTTQPSNHPTKHILLGPYLGTLPISTSLEGRDPDPFCSATESFCSATESYGHIFFWPYFFWPYFFWPYFFWPYFHFALPPCHFALPPPHFAVPRTTSPFRPAPEPPHGRIAPSPHRPIAPSPHRPIAPTAP